MLTRMVKAEKTDTSWQPFLTVIIPAYNEAEGIGSTLQSLRMELPQIEIIVVDDASTDGTPELAKKIPGVRVISHSHNCGYGGSLKTGMSLAQTEYIAWFDADGEHRTEDLIAMVDKLHCEKLTAVIGQRKKGSSNMVRTIGKFFIRTIAKSFDIRAGHDLNCGLRVFRRDVICRYLFVLPDGYSASLTSLMVLLERHYPMAFYPIQTAPRLGTSKVRLRDGFYTIALIIRITMLFAPLRIFLRSGGIIAAIGLIYSLLQASMQGSGFPVAGELIVILGILLMAVGLIADQISQLRLIQLASISSIPFRPIKKDHHTYE